MPNLGEVIVIYDLLPEMALKLDTALDQLVRKAAFDVQAVAQSLAPVNTGFLKASVYTRTSTTSGYSQVMQPPPGAFLFPETEKPETNHATVAVGASYGIFQEFGTTKMPAHPFLTPAVEIVRPQLVAALEKLEALMIAAAL